MNPRIPKQLWRWLYLATWVAAAAFMLLALGQWWSSGHTADRVGALVSRMSPQAEASDLDAGDDDNGEDAENADNAALPEDDPGLLAAQRINDRYIFHSAPQPKFRSIRGVLGNKVLFTNGGAVAVGETYDGATVKAIGGDWVELEYEGETLTVHVGKNAGRRHRPTGGPPRPAAVKTDVSPTDHAPGASATPQTQIDGDLNTHGFDAAALAEKFGVSVDEIQKGLDGLSAEELNMLKDHLND